jgi:hypothetical protein
MDFCLSQLFPAAFAHTHRTRNRISRGAQFTHPNFVGEIQLQAERKFDVTKRLAVASSE